MRCVRITIIMKMGFAAVLTMNMVTSAGMITAMSRNTSTAMTKRAAAAKLMLMKNMNMLLAAVKNMSTIISAAVVGKNTTITNISMAKVVVVGNIITMSMMIAAAADMNIITATMFRDTRRTVSAKSAIRTKNTATCAAKALKTVPAVCRTLTA